MVVADISMNPACFRSEILPIRPLRAEETEGVLLKSKEKSQDIRGDWTALSERLLPNNIDSGVDFLLYAVFLFE
jgi:hypothetical protein